MRSFVSLVILFYCSVTLAAERPNFLVILVDDMGYSDPQCFGGEVETPNLNQLADHGVRFSQFYNCARCCPTRASLLTGSYPHRVGLGRNGRTMDLEVPTVAELLKDVGYQTAMTGKWHLSELATTTADQDRIGWMNHQVDLGIPFADPRSYPTQRGFDHYYGVIWGVVDFFDPFSLVHGNQPVPNVPEGYYLTDAITDYSVNYIEEFEKDDDQPFFMYVAYTAPHWPLHAKPDVIQKYDGRYDAGWEQLKTDRFMRQRKMKLFPNVPVDPVIDRGTSWNDLSDDEKEYQANKFEVHAAMVDSVDQGIGRILEALKASGEYDNTVIFFLSDNGASPEIPGYAGYDRNGETRDGKTAHRERELKLPENRSKLGSAESYTGLGPAWANAANSPLKYWKKESYEGGCRTPFIIHWPAGLKQRGGNISKDLGHVMDIAPTCLELAGAKSAEDFPMDGVSMVGLLNGQAADPDRMLFFEHMGGRAARHRQWKISALAGKPWELYNVERDPAETTNMILEQPTRLDDLRYRWEDWLGQMPQTNSQQRNVQAVKEAQIAKQPVKLTCKISTLDQNGVIVAQGGSSQGISLHIKDRKITFNIRINGKVTELTTPTLEGKGPVEIEANLEAGGKLRLAVDGTTLVTGDCGGLIPVQPQDGLSINDDSQSNVGNYGDDFRYGGKVSNVEVQGLGGKGNSAKDEQANAGDKDAPNFIVILTDDQGWGTTSIRLDPRIKESASDYFRTPNMERIANAGMRFTQAYSAHPNCSPSRAALLTGISPAAMHMSDIVDRNSGRLYEGNRLNPPQHVNKLDSELSTIPELLKLHNRACRAAHFGKWHLNGGGPEAHGFDVSDGPTSNREGTVPSNQPDDPKRAFSMTRSSIRFMEQQVRDERPFYLQVSHYATHLGYQATADTIAELQDRKKGRRHNSVAYGSMIEDLDHSLGNLLDAVERLGIGEITYLIFTADNGTYPTEDPGNINGPLRGSKATLWEAGVRVPLMIVGPGIEAGSYTRTPAIGWDILPTICDIVGIEELDDQVEGGSLLPVLQRQPEASVSRPRDELYFHWPHYQHEKKSKPDSTVVSEDYKLHYFWESKETQLFKLSDDLAERENLAERYPEKTQQLKEKLMKYLEEIEAQLPVPNPEYSPATDPALAR